MTGQRAQRGEARTLGSATRPLTPAPPMGTSNMARLALGEVVGWGAAAELASAESHSWMVTIFRGGRCRCVRRAFFRW